MHGTKQGVFIRFDSWGFELTTGVRRGLASIVRHKGGIHTLLKTL